MLGEGGQVEGTVLQERAEEGGAQQREVAGAAGISAEFGIFAPSDIAAVVVGAFHPPVTADAGEPVAWSQCTALERGDKVAGLAACGPGLLIGHRAGDRDDGGGVGEAELLRSDGGEPQIAMLGATVVAVIGRKRGAAPRTACAAAAWTVGALPLSWIR